MNPEIRSEFKGPDALRVYRDGVGPTDYVQGRGADMVPSRVGRGDVGTYVIRNLGSPGERPPAFSERVICVLTGLSVAGIDAARRRIEALVKQKQPVTEQTILEALAA